MRKLREPDASTAVSSGVKVLRVACSRCVTSSYVRIAARVGALKTDRESANSRPGPYKKGKLEHTATIAVAAIPARGQACPSLSLLMYMTEAAATTMGTDTYMNACPGCLTEKMCKARLGSSHKARVCQLGSLLQLRQWRARSESARTKRSSPHSSA
jgi:hypothetical protein